MSHHSPAMPRQGLKGFRALGLPGVGVQDLQFGVQGATFSTKEMRNLNLGPRCLLTRLVSEGISTSTFGVIQGSRYPAKVIQ